MSVRFVIYATALIVVTTLALQFIEEYYGLPSVPEGDLGVLHYKFGSSEILYIDVTLDDVNYTLQTWPFRAANFSDSPLTLIQGGSVGSLKDALLDVLSRDVYGVTQEQYAIAGKALGAFTLRRNGTVEYPIISPYDPFVLRVQRANFYVPNVTYPPSADIFISKSYDEYKGSLLIRTQYKGYEVETRQSCYFFSCYDYKVLIVKFERDTYMGGHLVKKEEFGEDFSLSGIDDGECKYRSEGCTGDDDSCIGVVICRKGDDYTAKLRTYWFKDDGRYSGTIRVFKVHFNGFHGEKRVNVTAYCDHDYTLYWNTQSEDNVYVGFSTTIRKTVIKDSYTWSETLEIPVFFRGDTLARVYCTFGVDDVLKTPIGDIKRGFKGGYLSYYYRPFLCTPLCSDPVEEIRASSHYAPSHAKKPFVYDVNDTSLTEELILRIYAESIKRVLSNYEKGVFEKMKSSGLWSAFFGSENESIAKSVMDYFYLSQIPLLVEIDSKANLSKLETFFEKKGNESTVSQLYTLFENTTFVYPQLVEMLYNPPYEKDRKVKTWVILALTYDTNFTLDAVNTNCGKFAVAELAYYRQPALQDYEDHYVPPTSFKAIKGYSPLPGIAFENETLVCRAY